MAIMAIMAIMDIKVNHSIGYNTRNTKNVCFRIITLDCYDIS